MKRYNSNLERKNVMELNQEAYIEEIEESLLFRDLFDLEYWEVKESGNELIYSTSNPGSIHPKIRENYKNIMNTFKILLGANI
jgi:hypothetical protein